VTLDKQVDAPTHFPGRAWWIYRGMGQQQDTTLSDLLPPPPPWRDFQGGPVQQPPAADTDEEDRRLGAARAAAVRQNDHEVDMVNAALLLRRPLLVTGRPGIGKSCLAHRVAREFGLGRVLHWTITSRSTLRSGLYDYDAIGRAQAAATRRAVAAAVEEAGEPAPSTAAPDIGEFIQLGPLGTALLPYDLPRVLLIDELDKSDVDLPNDLLHVFENGEFAIRELARIRERASRVTVLTDDPSGTATVIDGRVRCRAFPFVVITSNGEREFPPAFLRRCLRLQLSPPNEQQLAAMVAAHFNAEAGPYQQLIRQFVDRSQTSGGLATDQLLNAIYLTTSGSCNFDQVAGQRLLDAVWHELAEPPP
jgi:MoxR-like ATPase